MIDYNVTIDGKHLLDFDDPTRILENCIITKKINDIGYLEFDMYSDHWYYDQIKSGDMVDVYENGVWIFKGRIGLIQVGTNLKKHIQAYDPIGWLDDICLNQRFEYTDNEHSPYASLGIIVNSYEAGSSNDPRGLNFITGFSTDFVTNTGSDAFNASDTSFSTCLTALNNIFVNDGYVNLYVSYDQYPMPTMIIRDIEPNPGTGLIEFGNNIVDFSRVENIKQSYNYLTPYTSSGLTISSIANGVVAPGIQKSGIRIWDEAKRQEYDGQCTSVQFEASNANELLACGIDWLQRQNKLSSITVRAVDLSVIDSSYTPLDIWQKVRCISEPHGVDEILTCTELTKNITSPDRSSYTIGHREKSLTQKIKEL